MKPRLVILLLWLAFVAVILHSGKQPAAGPAAPPESGELPMPPPVSAVPPKGDPLSRDRFGEVLRLNGETRFLAGFARMLRELDVRELPDLLDLLEEEKLAHRLPEKRWMAARVMAEERCAHWFPQEVLRRTDPQSPFNEGNGALMALRGLLPRDQALAVSEFQRLTMPGCKWLERRWSDKEWSESQPFLSGFLAGLAALDPALAKEELLRLQGHLPPITRHAMDMMRVWTAKDPEGVRAFLKPFTFKSGQAELHGPFWETLYLEFPDLAAQWMEELAPDSRDYLLKVMFYGRKSEDLANTLLLAKRAGKNVAWAQCAAHWRLAGKNLDELGDLLQQAPPEAREEMLVAYYGADRENVLLEPAEITKLCQFLDPKDKPRLLLKLVRAQFSELPVQRGLKACLMAEDAALLFQRSRIEEPHMIVEFLLAEEPLKTLDWLWGGLSKDGRMALAGYWPYEHARDSSLALMAESDPMRQALGRAVAKRWFQTQPLEAWPVLVSRMPGWLAEEDQMKTLAKFAREKGVEMETLLKMLPDDQSTRIARANLLSLGLKEGASDEAAEMSLRQLRDAKPAPAPDTIAGMAEGLVKLRSETVGEIILMLPPDDPRRDKLLARRGLFQFSENRVGQAMRTWRLAKNPAAVLDLFGDGTFEKKDWQTLSEVMDFVAHVPASDPGISQSRNRAIHILAVKMFQTDFARTMALGRENSSKAMHRYLWEVAPLIVKTKDEMEQLQREAVIAGMDKDPDHVLRMAGLRARLDPEWVLKEAIRAGDGRDVGRWNQAAGQLIEKSPVRALRVAINHAGSEVSIWLTRKLIDELSKTEPDWVFPAALTWQQVFPRDGFVVEFLRRWAEIDPASAARAAEQLPSGPIRAAAFSTVLAAWYDKAPVEAIAWSKGLGDPLAKSEADVALLTPIMRADPLAAAKLCLDMPIDQPGISEERVEELVEQLAYLSYADAAGFLHSFIGRRLPKDQPGSLSLSWKIENAWGRTIHTWYNADARALREFLATLPQGEVGNHLRELAARSMKPTDIRPDEFLPGVRDRFRAIAAAEGVEAVARMVQELPEGPDQKAALQAAFEIALRENRFAVLEGLKEKDRIGDVYAQALRAHLFPDAGWTNSSVIRTIQALSTPEAAEVRLDMLGVLGWKWLGDPWRCGDLIGLMAMMPDDEARRVYQVFRRLCDSEPMHLLVLHEARNLKDGEIPNALLHLKNLNIALARGDKSGALECAMQLPQPWFDHLPAALVSRMTAGEWESARKAWPESHRLRLEGIRALLAPLRP